MMQDLSKVLIRFRSQPLRPSNRFLIIILVSGQRQDQYPLKIISPVFLLQIYKKNLIQHISVFHF